MGCIARGEYLEESGLLKVPKNRGLAVSRSAGICTSDVSLTHRDSGTRFVEAFKTFVLPAIQQLRGVTAEPTQKRSACVVVSKDADVTVILTIAECMESMNERT